MFHSSKKDILYRLAVTHGIASVDELQKYLPVQTTPTVNGWLSKFLQLPKKFAATRRYINRFKLGADPEFCFGGAGGDRSRIDASLLGFMQGPAFGADNNGRLAEIRPYPSRSAVKVVASILTTLRWMALLQPNVLPHDWVSGAYLWDDGIGGHVHFGRKRPTRKQEVEALDNIEECLLYLRVYPYEQVARRRRGDARHQVYGTLGDFRLQQHGYEYRTFPSWLDSPALAFITLVVSKLAVQAPDLYRFMGAQQELQRLRNFLAYFKTLDDDARLALVLLDRGLPVHQGGDFKSRWGITSSAVQSSKYNGVVQVLPPSIQPDLPSVGEVFDYLQTGAPLKFRVPGFTWHPVNPPTDYNMCIRTSTTVQQKGLGEMVWDLCSHRNATISFVSGPRTGIPLGISRDIVDKLPPNWGKTLKNKAAYADLRPGTISIVPDWREGAKAREIRKILLSGVLPLWRVQDCEPDSYDKWQAAIKRPKTKFAGKVLFESTPFKIGPLD